MRIILLTAFTLLVAVVDCLAADGPQLAAAEKLLNLTGEAKDYQRRLSEAKPVLKEQNEKTAAFWKELHARLVAVYADSYSPQELATLIAFFESPAGRSFSAKQPEIRLRMSTIASDRLMQFMGVE
jgi:hypothetical protein